MSELFQLPKVVPLNNAGSLLPGAKLSFYQAGTSTLQAVYTDSTLSVAHTNPVIADGNGVFAPIYLDESLSYKITLTQSDDSLVYTVDNYNTSLTQSEVGNALYRLADAETAESVTPTNYGYEVGNVLRYGAVADGDGAGGGTDNSTALADWLKVVGQGVKGILPPGIYRCDTPLVLTDKTAYIFAYGATLDFSNNNTAGARALTIQGSESSTTTTLTANANQGATALTVASEAGFSGWIAIVSDSELLANEATYVKGELQQIESTSANTLTLYSGTKTSYDQATPTVTITKIDMIEKPVIKGLKIIGSGTIADDHIGIAIAYAVEPIIRDCTVVDCASTGMDFNRCTDGLMIGCKVENANDNVGATGYCYSFSPLTQFSSVESCKGRRFKHAFTTGGLLPVWGWSLSDCQFENQIKSFSTYAIDPHANGVNGTIDNVTVDYAYAGIRCRGPSNKISNCTVTNIYSNQCYELALDGPVNGQIIDCYGEGLNGIKINDDTGATDFVTTVKGNTLIAKAVNAGTIGTGIIANGPNVFAKTNTVVGFSPGITSNSNDGSICDNDIVDTVATGNAYGIYLLTGTDTRVYNNRVYCPNSTTMTRGILIAAAVTNARIINNEFDDYTASAIDDSGTGTIKYSNLENGVLRDQAVSDGTTGGTGSAGAGNQFVEIEIEGTTYRVLHDGTV